MGENGGKTGLGRSGCSTGRTIRIFAGYIPALQWRKKCRRGLGLGGSKKGLFGQPHETVPFCPQCITHGVEELTGVRRYTGNWHGVGQFAQASGLLLLNLGGFRMNTDNSWCVFHEQCSHWPWMIAADYWRDLADCCCQLVARVMDDYRSSCPPPQECRTANWDPPECRRMLNRAGLPRECKNTPPSAGIFCCTEGISREHPFQCRKPPPPAPQSAQLPPSSRLAEGEPKMFVQQIFWQFLCPNRRKQGHLGTSPKSPFMGRGCRLAKQLLKEPHLRRGGGGGQKGLLGPPPPAVVFSPAVSVSPSAAGCSGPDIMNPCGHSPSSSPHPHPLPGHADHADEAGLAPCSRAPARGSTAAGHQPPPAAP